MPSYAPVKTRLTAPAALLAALVTANPCYGQPFHTGGGGLFIGYGGKSLIWGIEAYATRSSDGGACSQTSRWSFGPTARWTLHGLSRPSFTLSAFAGRDLLRPVFAPIGEVGLTVAFPDGINADAVLSPHTGISLEMVVLQVFTHQEWLLQEYQVGGGARFIPAMGLPNLCVMGRPQRNAEGERLGAMHPTERGPFNGEKESAFRKAAAEEYASVPAFLQLARELSAHAAPRELVQRALVAALDELRHTALCAGALTHLTGRTAALNVPQASVRPPLLGRSGLLRLAAESWLDGCLGEGLAAALARHEQQSETDPVLRGVHAIIARDEHLHAELAWDILEFCLEREPETRNLLSSLADVRIDPKDVRHAAMVEHSQAAAARRLLELCG